MVKVTIETTDDEMQMVLELLSQQPYSKVAKTITSFYSQCSVQVQQQKEQFKE
jgi:hypothetical protein